MNIKGRIAVLESKLFERHQREGGCDSEFEAYCHGNQSRAGKELRRLDAMLAKLIPYRVHGVYGGSDCGDFVGFYWAENEDAAKAMCIAEMDEVSEYSKAVGNTVDGNDIEDMRNMLKNIQKFINEGPEVA